MAASVDPRISNVLGYLCGLATSFELNRRYVFPGSGARAPLQGMRFLVAFVISYGANFLTLSALLSATSTNKYLAQGISTAVYIAVFFMLSKLYVFSNRD